MVHAFHFYLQYHATVRLHAHLPRVMDAIPIDALMNSCFDLLL
jgi:hypothetical protein